MASPWTAANVPAQNNKIAIVTGANSGLGLETTAGLAAAGARVIMACRNPDKAKAAIDEVRRRVPQAQIEPMALDVADLSSVRRFAEEFSSLHPRLDLLCNNAGVMAIPYQLTPDGFEMQFGTNHLGHFALTGLLMERLLAAPAARVVSVSSNAHKVAREMNLQDHDWKQRRYDKATAYARSKLANLLFSLELDRRFRARGASAIAVTAHPGYALTNLMGPMAESRLLRPLLAIGGALLAQPASMGALPTLYAATMPDVAGGDYYGPHGFMEFRGYPVKAQRTRAARDAESAKALWTLSEKLTGVAVL